MNARNIKLNKRISAMSELNFNNGIVYNNTKKENTFPNILKNMVIIESAIAIICCVVTYL